jgi:hypothetical protein
MKTPKTAGYQILETLTVADPHTSALRFGAFLGADKGVASTVRRLSAKVVDCVASDGRAIRFLRA